MKGKGGGEKDPQKKKESVTGSKKKYNFFLKTPENPVRPLKA